MSFAEMRPHLGNVAKGVIRHVGGMDTPPEAYLSMINLHGLTQGRATDWLSTLLSVHRRRRRKPIHSNLFGNVDDAIVSDVVDRVKDAGYAVLPMKLPQKMIDQLVNFAKTEPAVFQGGATDGREVFEEHNARARLYKFPAAACLRSPEVQRVLADSFFSELAASYLGVTPIVDVLTMWWSAVLDGGDASEAAQLFHFDMDRPKWLKLFVYLTDVDDTAGPHIYVAKSHRLRNERTGELLRRGYVRISDEDIIDCYGAESLHSIGGPAGTIFVADTRGFHKGLPPTGRSRLVLQLSYATTLFGGAWKHVSLPRDLVAELREARSRCPVLFSMFK